LPGKDVAGDELEEIYQSALTAMCSNLNSPVALAKSIEAARLICREDEQLSASSGQSALRVLDKFNALLGVIRSDYEPDQQETPASVQYDQDKVDALLQERRNAKAQKDFERADEIRAHVTAMGFEVRDTPQGDQWLLRRSRRRVTISR
jgi:cysteinyl-tRNA synthetase